mmetsp:Transcript_36335/g.116419  ORF Transcript_36335/g.116419 Transcript_36335/m.116419 type:complete len:274 (-) Transcript_36335:137-958(-)
MMMGLCVVMVRLLVWCGLGASAFVALPPVVPQTQRVFFSSTSKMSVQSSFMSDVAVVVLAGGSGSRMKADRPKQFLELKGKTVLAHSLELFLGMEALKVVVVLDEAYRGDLANYDVSFADPGAERQDSVRSGVEACPADAALICIHDAARPLVTPEAVSRVVADARQHGAAVLGVPVKPTVKESQDGHFVTRTLDRSKLWEVQTPQVITPHLLHEGFAKVKERHLDVTDDVSLVEHIGKPVKLTLGDYDNIKLTTPDDLIIADNILDQRRRRA